MYIIYVLNCYENHANLTGRETNPRLVGKLCICSDSAPAVEADVTETLTAGQGVPSMDPTSSSCFPLPLLLGERWRLEALPPAELNVLGTVTHNSDHTSSYVCNYIYAIMILSWGISLHFGKRWHSKSYAVLDSSALAIISVATKN